MDPVIAESSIMGCPLCNFSVDMRPVMLPLWEQPQPDFRAELGQRLHVKSSLSVTFPVTTWHLPRSFAAVARGHQIGNVMASGS